MQALQESGDRSACGGTRDVARDGKRSASAHGGSSLGARALARGARALRDGELLALLVGRASRPAGAVEPSASLLVAAGGLEGLARLGPAWLAQQPGLGRAKALRIVAAIELGRRVRVRAAACRQVFADADAVAHSFCDRIGTLDHEQMWVLSLDGRNRAVGARRVAQGGRHGLAVGAREILAAALRDGASGFVLVHNHPSGEPRASPEDLHMTRAVAAAARVVGVPLLDHVVVTASGAYTSLAGEGRIDD